MLSTPGLQLYSDICCSQTAHIIYRCYTSTWKSLCQEEFWPCWLPRKHSKPKPALFGEALPCLSPQAHPPDSVHLNIQCHICQSLVVTGCGPLWTWNIYTTNTLLSFCNADAKQSVWISAQQIFKIPTLPSKWSQKLLSTTHSWWKRRNILWKNIVGQQRIHLAWLNTVQNY